MIARYRMRVSAGWTGVLAASTLWAISAGSVWAQGGNPAGDTRLLPDLIPWVDEDQGYLYGWTIDQQADRTLLRITTATANVGQGPLEIRGGAVNGAGSQEVRQRIYRQDNTYTERLAGNFVFHPEHNHIHFADFAQYNLREVLPSGAAGNIVATGGKTSFCLVDFDGYDRSLPGTPGDGAKYAGCGTELQGISVGWADIYEEDLPDQWIDVTGVTPGSYWLELVVDPENRLVEKDETNNVSRIKIDFDPRVTMFPKDRYEPNDGGQHATGLGNVASHRLTDLTIHAAGNEDVFAWTAPSSGLLTVKTASMDLAGDINLFVYRNTPVNKIGQGVSQGSSERVQVPVSQDSLYWFRVIGTSTHIPENYELSFDLTPIENVRPLDRLEPNNHRTRSTVLAEHAELADLSIHSALDSDYFRWIAPADGTLSISAVFSHDESELDLSVFSFPRNDLIEAAERTAAGSELSIGVKQGVNYIVRAIGRDYATVSQYGLSVRFQPQLPEPASGTLVLPVLALVGHLRSRARRKT